MSVAGRMILLWEGGGSQSGLCSVLKLYCTVLAKGASLCRERDGDTLQLQDQI